MSDSQQKRSKQGKRKRIKKDDDHYKRKRTLTSQAQKDGKILYPCQFCSPNDRKIYQSYSALYYHVKQKHPEQKISSAKNKPKIDGYNPILKLKTILKGNQKQREETQRELIDLKQIICLKLSQIFLEKKIVQFNQLGEQRTENHMKTVAEQSLRLSKQVKFGQQLFKIAENGEIFRYYYTKFGPISFGKDIVRYFAKNNKISSKLYLQMIIMQGLDQSLIDKSQSNHFQLLIWRQAFPFFLKLLKQQWIKWKSINKQLVIEKYTQDSVDS